MERRARRQAAASGLNEAVNWSFISEKEAAPFGGGDWTLANPISEDLKVMRSSLIPGLVSAAKRNMERGANAVRLFEVGRRYFKDKNGHSDEKLTLGLILSGSASPRNWQSGKAQGFTAYDAKAYVEAILAAAGAPVDKLMLFKAEGEGDEAKPGDHYHPGQSATLRLGPKNILASFGTLHPMALKSLGIKPNMGQFVAAEIYLDNIPVKPRKAGDHMRDAYAPPALQAVTRDFAFIVDADLPAFELVKAARGADKKNITDARIFDVFAGGDIGEGKKSLALEVTLQPGETSFTDKDLQAISDEIVKAAEKLGGALRGG